VLDPALSSPTNPEAISAGGALDLISLIYTLFDDSPGIKVSRLAELTFEPSIDFKGDREVLTAPSIPVLTSSTEAARISEPSTGLIMLYSILLLEDWP
jgi:hypothetical protein